MINEIKDILTKLFEKIEQIKTEIPSAGTKYRLMGLVADITEVTEMMQKEVLAWVSQEAVLDAGTDIDYTELSEQVLTKELQERTDMEEMVHEQTRQANEALGELSNVLVQIAEQLVRHHKDEEYARLYEAEKRRYMISGTSKRSRQEYEEWKDYECQGSPQLENIEDYRVEKLLKMFEKGVLSMRVEHMQRAKRYPEEIDFSQTDDNQKISKTVYHHYAALRKIVDFKDGCLVADPVSVGRYFYACRCEENAKAHRSSFLKYMHKITMVQEDYRQLAVAQKNEEERCLLPDMLATDLAMRYWERLQQAGFVDEYFQLSPNTTRKQAMYIADMFSEKLQLRSKWKPFQDLWHINNLAQEKWDMQETGKNPLRLEELEDVFRD